MTTQEQTKIYHTLIDLERVNNLPENSDRRFELIDGEIIEVNPPRPLHAFISGLFYAALHDFCRETDLGYAFPDSVGYALYADKFFIPDASFVSKAKIPGFPLPDEFHFAPDLAVEIVSPGNRPRDMLKKIETYLSYGTDIVWAAYPDEQIVDVYRKAAEGFNIRTFDINSTLDGEDVLPGFKLGVRRVFPQAQ